MYYWYYMYTKTCRIMYYRYYMYTKNLQEHVLHVLYVH